MHNTLLNLSIWFIQHIAPNNIKDDLSGDLAEEYTQHILPEQGSVKASLWLLRQTSLTCAHYVFTFVNGIAFIVALIGLSIFSLLAAAIFWLSNVPSFDVSLWQTWSQQASHHRLVFEPDFWQFIAQFYADGFLVSSFYNWIDVTAVFYSLLALYVLAKLDKAKTLTAFKYALSAIALMSVPYLWGTYQFLFNDMVTGPQTGPIVATMWLTIMYMILPTTYQLAKKTANRRTLTLSD